MKLIKSMLASALLAAGAAQATVVLPGSETSLQNIINGLYTCGTCSGAAAAPNVNTDQANAHTFAIEASGGSVATFVIEITANAGGNSFGIFDAADSTKKVQLFGATNPGDQVIVSIKADGSVFVNLADTGINFAGNHFGYYLQNPDGSTRRSTDVDQMVSFRGDGSDVIRLASNLAPGVWGASSYLLAFEDQVYANSDKDFNDFVVYVESVTKVPVPGTLALLGLGLVGLGTMRRRVAK